MKEPNAMGDGDSNIADRLDSTKYTPKTSISMKKWRELNEVHGSDASGNDGGVYWDGFSPPAKFSGRLAEFDLYHSSQSQPSQPESSPLTRMLVTKPRTNRPVIPRSKPKSQFQRQKSMEEIKNGGVTIIPKSALKPKSRRPKKAQSTKTSESSDSSGGSGTSATVSCEKSVSASVPQVSENDFPDDDDFDQVLILASQQAEEEDRKAKQNLETPKSVPKTGRRAPIRQLNCNIELEISRNDSLFESSIVEQPEKKQTEQRLANPDDVFDDADDSFFSQIVC